MSIDGATPLYNDIMATKNSKNASNKTNVRMGWHFLPADKKLSEGDGRPVQLGQTLTMRHNATEKPACCSYGMHASDQISQAARFEKGPVICRVEVWGDVAMGNDKFCGRHRRVIWWKELSKAEMASLCKAGGYTSKSTVDTLLSGMRYSSSLDADLEALAKKNGWDDAKNKLNPVGAVDYTFEYVKPGIDEKTIVSLLNTRVVKTATEIKRDLGDAFDMTNFDDVMYDVELNSRVIVIESFTKAGVNAYLVRPSR